MQVEDSCVASPSLRNAGVRNRTLDKILAYQLSSWSQDLDGYKPLWLHSGVASSRMTKNAIRSLKKKRNEESGAEPKTLAY